MPPRVTPSQYREKHNRRLKASIEDIRAGVLAVTDSPTAAAAKKADKMLAELNRAVTSGKWAARLNAITVDEWKTKTINKGIPRIATGIDEAGPKVEAFASQLLPFEANLMTQVERLPDVTLEDSITRATTWIREMSKFFKK
jgi:hypothetical protein